MTGTVELDRDGRHLLIRFPYREDLVAMVKELPGRRWDPRQKLWRVPAENVEAVYAACSRHLFEFAGEISQLLAGTLSLPADEGPAAKPSDPRRERAPEPTGAGADPRAGALTVSELNARVRDCLQERFPEPLWLVGEVVDFDKSAGRQHRFFVLAEKAEGAERARAVVEVALFAGVAERLLPALAAGEPPLTLRDGRESRAPRR